MNSNDSSTESEERLLRIIDEHWIKYVVPVFIYAVMSAAGFLLMIQAKVLLDTGYHFANAAFLLGLVLVCIAHHWFFAFLLGEVIDCLVLTNMRSIIFETKLLVHDDMIENSFDKMRSVEAYHHGILQNILRYGTLRFQGGMDIPLVPHVHRVAKEIQQAMGRR